MSHRTGEAQSTDVSVRRQYVNLFDSDCEPAPQAFIADPFPHVVRKLCHLQLIDSLQSLGLQFITQCKTRTGLPSQSIG